MGFPKPGDTTAVKPFQAFSSGVVDNPDLAVIQKAMAMIGLEVLLLNQQGTDDPGEVWVQVRKFNPGAPLTPIPEPEEEPEFSLDDLLKRIRLIVEDEIRDALHSAISAEGNGTMSLAEQIQDLWDTMHTPVPEPTKLQANTPLDMLRMILMMVSNQPQVVYTGPHVFNSASKIEDGIIYSIGADTSSEENES